MKYYEVSFCITASEQLIQSGRDVLAALLGEVGFESFEESPEGLKGYIQQDLFNEEELKASVGSFPLPDVSITYKVTEADYQDWNEQWENEGFEPIVVDGQCVIHDGRHMESIDLQSFPVVIEIDAKLAFGTGTHETTKMMVSTLLGLQLKAKNILDCGTGTGILSITALKLGAAHADAYDIDEWSVDNARHNAIINHVDNQFSVTLGDSHILKAIEGNFQIVMANINRNILLQDMPAFMNRMEDGGLLILSGFYESDIPLLKRKATGLGLQEISRKQLGDWACLCFKK